MILKYISCIAVSICSVVVLFFLTFGMPIFELVETFPFIGNNFAIAFFDSTNLKSTILLFAIIAESVILAIFGLQPLTKPLYFLSLGAFFLAICPILVENAMISPYVNGSIDDKSHIMSLIVGLSLISAMLLKYITINPMMTISKIDANGFEKS